MSNAWWSRRYPEAALPWRKTPRNSSCRKAPPGRRRKPRPWASAVHSARSPPGPAPDSRRSGIDMKSLFSAVLASAIAWSTLAAAQAGSYPARPVRIMVGASAGGGTDIIARVLAEKFTEGLKQPFVVENRPGASNTIAADITAKAQPDGYTLLVGTNTAQAIAPHLIKLAYDPLKDVQPVGLIVVVPNVLIVGPAVKAKSVQELLTEMRTASAAMRYATAGTRGTQHNPGEDLANATGTQLNHVP